jgi:hypothetical protein
MKRSKLMISLIMAFVLGQSVVMYAAKSEPRHIGRAELLDKIKGGWAGQMIGVSYGAPTEFRAQGKILEGELKWDPDRVENSIHQDDLYVEMTFAHVMDTVGLNATSEQYGEAFKTSKYGLWHANAAARRNLNRGIKAPMSGNPRYNIHANDIDFQIEADFIGLMSPGLPRYSNLYCDRVGRVMNYGDGVYGGMFVCGMYSAAYFESDPRKVVEAGLACIPSQSSYAAIIRDLLEYSASNPEDWRKVWQLIEDKWDKDDVCPDGALQPFNIDAKLNGAYIAFGLLFGKGDFGKTMEIATRCGQDSDCNPSSAAGVLGVTLGYSKIPDFYKGGIDKIADTKFEYTDYSFKDIVKSTEDRAMSLIAEAGGKITETDITLPTQTPRPPKLEQWNPGHPYKIVNVQDASWTWQGNWQDDKNTKAASSAGAEATLRFEGVAVALMGQLSQEGGRADVYLDGRKLNVLDAYIVPNTFDNTLWHAYSLKLGRHTLRIVLREDSDERSKGKKVAIQQAVLYKAD